MANLILSAEFAITGEPAVGLVLADIEVTLTRVPRTTGNPEFALTAVAPTAEANGTYTLTYQGAMPEDYTYTAVAEYTGVVVVDEVQVPVSIIATSVGMGGVAPSIGYALPETALSLFAWARIFGINPVHLAGGTPSPLFPEASCDRVWSRYLWQQPDQESWESILLAIQEAENTISNHMGYKVAPTWTAGRTLAAPVASGFMYTNGINIMRQRQGIYLEEDFIIAPGRRAVTELALGVTVEYLDTDTDDLFETAHIRLTLPEETVVNWQQVKVYFSGKAGDTRWEVRPLRSITISDEGDILIVFDSWLLTNPDTQSRFPGRDGLQALDFNAVDYFVPTVDVYVETNDRTAVGSQYLWEKMPYSGLFGSTENEPIDQTQDGTFVVRQHGMIAPVPAVYDAEAGQWNTSELSGKRSPDRYKLWYYSGKTSTEWERGLTHDPLDSSLATAIAYLSAARLSRDICVCGENKVLYLRELNTFTSPGGNFLAISDTLQQCPFGPRRGEWLAYNMMSYPTAKRHIRVGVG